MNWIWCWQSKKATTTTTVAEMKKCEQQIEKYMDRQREREISVRINESTTIIVVTTFRIFDLFFSPPPLSLSLSHTSVLRFLLWSLSLSLCFRICLPRLKSRQCQQLASNCILKYARTHQHTCILFCRSPTHFTIIHFTNIHTHRKFFQCISKRKYDKLTWHFL